MTTTQAEKHFLALKARIIYHTFRNSVIRNENFNKDIKRAFLVIYHN